MEGPRPLSSLRLLVPPLRVMTAAMWKVLRLRSATHYGIVEEFVSLVTEAVPDILTDRQMRLLTLGLRAKMTFQMLSSEQSEDLRDDETLLSSLRPSRSKQVHPGNEALEANFARLVQRVLEDPKEREHFLKNVFPVEFGPDFDAALETLVCEFFTRLEESLLIPDFKQTAVWMSDTPSVLEEYMQCVSKEDDLKVLLRSKAHCGKMAETDTGVILNARHRCRGGGILHETDEIRQVQRKLLQLRLQRVLQLLPAHRGHTQIQLRLRLRPAGALTWKLWWEEEGPTASSVPSSGQQQSFVPLGANIGATCWRPMLCGWRPMLYGWRPMLEAHAGGPCWRPMLCGWWPVLCGWRQGQLGRTQNKTRTEWTVRPCCSKIRGFLKGI